MRKFNTGATRDSDEGKIDYDGFLSPLTLEAFGRYMHKHRIQADGGLRDSDNWQKGIPEEQYRKSAWRHFVDVWKLSRGYEVEGVDLVEALCAVMFNVQGMLHETLKKPVKRTVQMVTLPPGADIRSIEAYANYTGMSPDAIMADLMDEEAKPDLKRPKSKLREPGEKPQEGPLYYERIKEGKTDV